MTFISKDQSIKSIEKKEDYLSITFTKAWNQEEISKLVALILRPTMPAKIVEKNMGADREDIRFMWDDHFFVLNFDCYSQSSWVEGHDHNAENYLEVLYLALTAGE